MAFAFTACSNSNEEEIAKRDEGIAFMDEGDYESAIASFDEALSMSIGKVTELEIDIDYYKAAAEYNSNQFDEAIYTYTALIKYDSKNYKPYFLRGSIYANSGEINKATSDYDSAVSIDEKNYLLYIEIYENLNALGYTNEGLSYLTKALEVSDKSADSYYYKGRIYYMLGDTENAVSLLETAIDKDVTEAKLYLAKLYQDQGDSAMAQSLLSDYATSDEVTSTALGTLGDIEMSNGDYASALSYYNAGLNLEEIDNYSQLYKGATAALEYLGEFDEAEVFLTQYLELYPTDEQAQNELIFLKTR